MSVLIVEDEPALRDLLCETLSLTYPCVAVPTAEEALRLLGRRRFDVILTDVGLPGMSGLEFVRRLYALQADACIVVMSGEPLDGSHEWGALGVYAYLIKPFGTSDVEQYVAKAFEHCRSEKQGDEGHTRT